MEEAKDLNTLSYDNLIGLLISYKENLAIEKGHKDNKKKNIILKASRLGSNEESEFANKDIATITRKLKDFSRSQVREESLRTSNKKWKKKVIVRFECKKAGHIKLECPFFNNSKLKTKAIVAIWDDSDEESTNEEQAHEVSNVALMVIGDE